MLADFLMLGLGLLLVLVNGFFVAAEFALVKIRPSRIDALVREGRAFAKTARWLFQRMDKALSACQLGITMASLALGWVGEPAFAHLLEPVFHAVGIDTPAVIHAVSFVIAFGIITALHLVIGEQAPKIFALRRPEIMTLWCAPLLKAFYVISYPMLIALDGSTRVLLRRLGVEGTGHDTPHSEAEIRALLSQAHRHGELSRAEHRLLHAVFEFDDTVCRQIMVPRNRIEAIRADDSREDILAHVRRTTHTRFPVYRESLDDVVGVLHIKDLVTAEESAEVASLVRPVRFVPESMSISVLLRQFQASRQHLALVSDEHGTVIGMVTMENIIERIIGSVQDEFDDEPLAIVPDGPRRYLVRGDTAIDDVNAALGLDLMGQDVDTMSGLMVERCGRVPAQGTVIELEGVKAEAVESSGARIAMLRLVMEPEPNGDDETDGHRPVGGLTNE